MGKRGEAEVFPRDGYRCVLVKITTTTKTNDGMRCNAMRCSAVQCNAIYCNTMRCDAMRCNAMRCDATRCNVIRCNAMQCDATRCNAMQRDATRCNAPFSQRRGFSPGAGGGLPRRCLQTVWSRGSPPKEEPCKSGTLAPDRTSGVPARLRQFVRICSFVGSFVRSFVCSFVRSFVCLFHRVIDLWLGCCFGQKHERHAR